ncbi:hypothetical protein [Streptomyces sp. NPDC006134]|uniref:hypothetical protein n=1 Tax=Streptomyces sp. NPDC006134 TaxID=3154467 RepID=UPI0033D8D5E7
MEIVVTLRDVDAAQVPTGRLTISVNVDLGGGETQTFERKFEIPSGDGAAEMAIQPAKPKATAKKAPAKKAAKTPARKKPSSTRARSVVSVEEIEALARRNREKQQGDNA